MNPRPTDATSTPATPKSKARLEALVTQWRKDSGQPVARLNLRIAAMMLAGALARVVDPNGDAMFATKGGIAMELRMGEHARTTRDIDLVLRTAEDAIALAELRKSRDVTQIALAAQLGITQGNVSRIEGRSEIYLSTLRSYIEALGGHLEIAAVFGEDRIPVAVGIGTEDPGD